MSVWQLPKDGDKFKIRQIHELPAIEPENTATRAGKKLVNWLNSIGYIHKAYLYGDKSTKNRNNIDDNKRTFFMIIMEALLNAGFKVEDKILSGPPPVHSIGEFVNAILSGELEFAEIEINQSCITSVTDYQNVKKDENGNILKVRVKHPTIDDVTYEKDGHFTDTFKDFIIQAFFTQYQAFVNRHKKLIPGGISQINRQGNITF